MFFNRKSEKEKLPKYESFPASGVDFKESFSESYTNNLPHHTVIDKNTWEYEKMKDVPFPIGEDWEWIDCYKVLYKIYSLSKDKVEYLGPSRGFIYELNKIYALPEEKEFSKIDYCGNGFHACLTVKNALSWYNYITYNTDYNYHTYDIYSVNINLSVIAKAKILVNKKDLSNCYKRQKLDKGKIVGKAIVLTGFISPKEVYDNQKENVYWDTSVLNNNACEYLKAVCKTKGVSLNTFKRLSENLNITFFDYKKMLDLIENGKPSTMAYVQCMFDAYVANNKEVSQCLDMNYGHVLTEEIINHLDYQLAMKLADSDDVYTRSLSVAEKMQILYSHQMLLKK